ncbi:unnamed protein product [Rhizoctonia solani]|uniref:Ataxin-10 homolog n=1 Tax=Rhizoctonia solani TaxID=456999 RepID=A0A8H3H748_9AGAM|nr:unnamed protein product [Rhizoctonia solani]
MTLELSDDALKLVTQMKEASQTLSEIDSLNLDQATILGELAKCAVNEEQRILLGQNETIRKSVIWMWRLVGANIEGHDKYIATDSIWSYIYNLARLTGNLAVKCENNQTWITRECEPHMRYVVHFLTSWYHIEEIPDRSMVMAIARCLSNIVTGNKETSRIIWTKYMSLLEKDNVIMRLLQYPDRRTSIATLVFILNSLTTDPNQSLVMATQGGGRAICVSLLEMADRVYENDRETDLLQLIFNIFIKLFEDGGLAPLYQTLQSQDGTISPHQITLLKLLDGYVDTKPIACEDNTITSFLTTTLSTLLQATQSRTVIAPSSEGEFSLNESLPLVSAATVLVSQMLSNTLMAEQTAWEKSMDKQVAERSILSALRDQSNIVELIIDVLRRLDKLLPRIQFGKAKPNITEVNTSSADKATLPASRFQFQKRDLVRLLGILVHDDRRIQTRVREAGGVQLILGLCAVDENNPFIREHALFALRNLLYKNPENQQIVQEMEPMGRIDENGILTGI